ncbi:MAG: RidA family protein [Clostridia bacterium]|nr:RidA family protein [Clostridia bacterium]
MSKQTVHSDRAPRAIGPYSQGIWAGDTLYLSGQLGTDPATGCLAEGVENQTHAAMRNIGAILDAAGLTYDSIVKTTIFVQDLRDFAKVNEVYASYFAGAYPARSCVQVAALPKGGLVEIECVAMK